MQSLFFLFLFFFTQHSVLYEDFMLSGIFRSKYLAFITFLFFFFPPPVTVIGTYVSILCEIYKKKKKKRQEIISLY